MHVGFTIDKDLVRTNAKGICWAPNLNDAKKITRFTPGAKRFHAYDDDGEHYYSGWLLGDCWEVIYEWAASYAGCTLIKDGNKEGVIG
jgi:hypothetical protein